MTRAAAHKLARLLRSQGFKVCIRRRTAPGIFFTQCIIVGSGPALKKHACDSRSMGARH